MQLLDLEQTRRPARYSPSPARRDLLARGVAGCELKLYPLLLLRDRVLLYTQFETNCAEASFQRWITFTQMKLPDSVSAPKSQLGSNRRNSK